MSTEKVCHKSRTIHTCPCYCDTLVAAKHTGLICLYDLMLVLECVENQTTFSVRSKNVCMITCNIHLAIQLMSLESFECTYKKCFFVYK